MRVGVGVEAEWESAPGGGGVKNASTINTTPNLNCSTVRNVGH